MNFPNILRQIAQREASVQQLGDLQRGIFAEKLLPEIFPNHFLIHKQADFGDMGGDFMVCERVGGFSMLAVVDSIGHSLEGVAGSLAVYVMLCDAWQKGLHDPAKALEHMHAMATHTFRNKVTADLGICRYDHHTRTLLYAGAKRRAHLMNEAGDLHILQAARISIGQERGEPGIACHEAIMHPRTRLYMSTDGMESQPGGPQGKVLGSRNLRKWIKDTSAFALADQGKSLQSMWSNWMDGRYQVDDVILLGVEF